MIKGQDILILLKLIVLKNSVWKFNELAEALFISPAEANYGFRRLVRAKLVEEKSRKPMYKNSWEFLIHGFKYCFPARLGPVSRGIPTAYSTKPLDFYLNINEKDMLVWPHEEGYERGMSIEPIYPSVPKAALKDPKLYEYLALLDALRIGRAREVQLAKRELRKRF